MRKIAGCEHFRLVKNLEKSENTKFFEPVPGSISTAYRMETGKGKVIGYDRENEKFDNKRNDRRIIMEKNKRDRAKEKKD